MRVAMVTNIPAPYRLPVYELVADTPGIELKTFFFAGSEPDRKWDLPQGKSKQFFLKEFFITVGGRFIHFNPDIWGHLSSFKPDVVITTGFNPTHLLAYAYARLKGLRHVAMTDGTLESEVKLSGVHRWVRRLVFAGSQAFIGASDGAIALYKSYGIQEGQFFKSHLCANNATFASATQIQKQFDFIFCGRFVAIKSPLFVIDLAQEVARRLGRPVTVLFVGSGEMEPQMRAAASAAAPQVNATFAGFAQQGDLPSLYGVARIFIFPTQWDPWGVVANEACAAGLPVLVSPHAGSAGELVRHGENGFVLPLQLEVWADAACRLLTDRNLHASMAAKSRELVQEYSYANSALGIVKAVTLAARRQPGAAYERPRVVIVQRRMTHYRIPLFESVREKLDAAGVELVVVFGDATVAEQKKADSGKLDWGTYVPCRYGLAGNVCWQDFRPVIRDADLVVVTQENRLILNHWLLLFPRKFKMAFWGHGANLQSHARRGFKEKFKRWTTSRVDWWFGYTQMTAELVLPTGFPATRITVLNNTVDATEMQRQRQAVTLQKTQQFRATLGLGTGPIGIFVGSLYADKRLGFLLQAAALIQQRIPDFKLLIVGDGPERNKVSSWCALHPWSKWVGAQLGEDKVAHIALADVMLNPGLVGLGILDSFICGVPMLTTNCGVHSPEIAYLDNGVNGIMAKDDLTAYVDACVVLLGDATLRLQLRTGCLASAANLTVDSMAMKFTNGVLSCLAAPRHRAGRML